MTNKLQKYPAYKDSGVEWLGEIPEHWEVKKVTHIFNKIGSGTTPTAGMLKYYENGSINWLQTGDLNDSVISETSKKITKKAISDFTTLRHYPIDSIVIAMYGATIGKLGFLNIETTTNQACCVLGKPNNYSSKYGFYSFMNAKTSIISMSYGGGQPNISQDLVKSLRFPFPPLPEQTAIAAFLDRKTALIDQAIDIKQKQIELLKERRQILIHKAVTRGLNPNVKMKDSGVEWIGEVPEGWEVKRLKYVLTSKLKYGANESGIEYDITFPRYVRITDFGQDGKLSEENKLSLTWKQGGEYLLKDGDILFARSGATVGKTYQFKKSMSIEENYCYAGYLIKAEVNQNIILSDFLYLYTNSLLFNKWKDSIFIKSTIENIGADKYSILPVIVPSIHEQIQILEKYNLDDTKIATAISLKEQEIEKLKEYKGTLINSAVTGKVKV
jgi:type I restriction enzyme S subunit